MVTVTGATDHETVAEIELLYQQRMTVTVPTDTIPSTPDSALRLVKNTDPEFVGDVLPNSWDDATTTGHLDVVDIRTQGSDTDHTGGSS